MKKGLLKEGLYGITAMRFSKGRSNVEVSHKMVEGGISIIQYREKHSDLSFSFMLEECREIRKITKDHNVQFIVNDYPSLALACEADGIHLGQDDLPVDIVREIVGPEVMIGISTHSPEEARKALGEDIDYIGVGALFGAGVKKVKAVGVGYLEYIESNIDIDYVTIGGIKEHNIESVLERGAKTVCCVTEIVGAEDIVQKVQALNRIFQKFKK
ncbi:thiamine phosphate synthase [bacterium]|nr:thiamine phosphate synthase [bacterium]